MHYDSDFFLKKRVYRKKDFLGLRSYEIRNLKIFKFFLVFYENFLNFFLKNYQVYAILPFKDLNLILIKNFIFSITTMKDIMNNNENE